jgi:hypothetical protein
MMYPFVKTEKVGVLKCMVSFLGTTVRMRHPRPFFAWYRHVGLTPPSQGRAGAISNRRAQRFLPLAQRALGLALTGGVGWPCRYRAPSS